MRTTTRRLWTVAMGSALALGVSVTPAGTAEQPKSRLEVDTKFGSNGVASLPLSATEADRFLGATQAGKFFYVAGFTTTAGDQAMSVTKLNAKGVPVSSFGTNGTASVNVAMGGKAVELARSAVVLSDGKVVVGGPVEHDPKATGDAARDTDIALVRFTPAGQPDTTFGTGGVARFDLSPGIPVNSTTFRGDTAWGLAPAPGNSVIVAAGSPTKVTGRTDMDLVLMKVKKSGALDTSFATDGLLTFDKDGLSESMRHVRVSPDGKRYVATGYVTEASGAVTPIFLKFDANGKMDKKFGTNGAVTGTRFLAAVSESYAAGFQGDKIVFAGYGSDAPTEKVDLYSSRLTAAGEMDETYGTNGITRLDLAKEDDRARDLAITEGGLVVAVGSGKPDAANLNGLVVVLDRNGTPTPVGGTTPYLLQDLGGPNDAFFGVVATSDGGALVVGYRGEATGGNDQSAAIKLVDADA